MAHWASYTQFRCGHETLIHWAHGCKCRACLDCYPIFTRRRDKTCDTCEAKERRWQETMRRALAADKEKNGEKERRKRETKEEEERKRLEKEKRKWEDYLAKKD